MSRLVDYLAKDTTYRLELLLIAVLSVLLIVFSLAGFVTVTIVGGRLLIAALCVVLLARHVRHRDVGR